MDKSPQDFVNDLLNGKNKILLTQERLTWIKNSNLSKKDKDIAQAIYYSRNGKYQECLDLIEPMNNDYLLPFICLSYYYLKKYTIASILAEKSMQLHPNHPYRKRCLQALGFSQDALNKTSNKCVIENKYINEYVNRRTQDKHIIYWNLYVHYYYHNFNYKFAYKYLLKSIEAGADENSIREECMRALSTLTNEIANKYESKSLSNIFTDDIASYKQTILEISKLNYIFCWGIINIITDYIEF